ncbi:sodium channel and clathrin linker 1-like [Diorhabda sublineata]|uniref:sodium channel and clathrin linker 1-like n=1 Tax=Diorhabda sublineata TaxID=1163346 RepID=UPI0024E12A67|nr:sodium channel and clathrin linker 1-like [Diorhabda sublineata]
MDVSQLQILVADYENLVQELTQELKSVKAEYEELKSKVPSILNENQKLIEELKQYVTSKTSEESQTEFKLIQNLRSQINLVLDEKEKVTQLWKKASKSVETLENELNIYKSGNIEYFPKHEYLRAKKSYEETINKLENQIKILKNESETKDLEIQNLLKCSINNTETAKKSESKVSTLYKNIFDLENSIEALKNKCAGKEKLIKKVMDQNNEFKEKIIEAIEIVQAALNEKDASLLREAEIRSEMKKMNEQLDDIIKEVQEKCMKETDSIKEQAEFRYKDILKCLENTQDELKEKVVQNEKLQAKNIILQNEIDKFSTRGVDSEESKTSKLLILEKNLESTFQKLLVSEKQNIQLKSELDTIKNDMEQMAAYYERVLKTKDLEKLTLQNINNQHKSVIKENELKIKSLNNEIEVAKSQSHILEKDLNKHIEDQEKLINSIKIEKSELVSSFNEQLKQLNEEIELRNEINKKLLIETKDIINKLENLTKTLKTDARKVKKENAVLKDELQLYKRKLSQYREILNMLAIDVNKINAVNTDNQQSQPNILS